ncbi:hypothetical protein ACL6C3_25435 [Capilliphycus salinus ALCB114379]|uniref:hypothetical protein n=1 Tax=Capilliphycus salinus TaxID=2768948 RepID=UPI0039A47B83
MLKDQFTWDFWYLYEPKKRLYHLYLLSADWQYKQTETHHLYSQLTYATTDDFKSFKIRDKNIIPRRENQSIWTGCTINSKTRFLEETGFLDTKTAFNYLMFYTERQTEGDYFAVQRIKLARSNDLKNWIVDNTFSLEPELIDPNFSYFLRTQNPGDRTVHAWRDPFIFKVKKSYYMLVATKHIVDENHPQHQNACIALLKADENNLKSWEFVHPSLITGYEELELPQLYRNEKTDEIILLVSTWDERDYQQSVKRGKIYRERGQLLAFSAAGLEAALRGEFHQNPEIIIGENGSVQASIYGGVWISQLKAIVGFDWKQGGYQVIDSGQFPRSCENLVDLNSETRQLREIRLK